MSETEGSCDTGIFDGLVGTFQYVLKQSFGIGYNDAFTVGMIGVPYDEVFLPDNGRLYCSELVALAFQAANDGEAFFKTSTMTYKDPSTGDFFPAWVDYFKDLNTDIPEGLPGCNPGGLSRDEKLEIIWLDGGL